MFASAYTLKKKNFVRNLSYIFGLGVLGTVCAMVVISIILMKANEYYRDPVTQETWVTPSECLLLASVLASTDTVAVLTLITPEKYEVLNAVLFGEGVVNDAVTILLYQAVESQINSSKDKGSEHVQLGFQEVQGMVLHFFALGFKSILMGAFIGLASALILKHVDLRYDSVKECIIMLCFAFLSYLAAEQRAYSGIISMFSSGLFMAHYTFWNVSKKCQKGTKMTVNTVSNLSQSFLYIYLGLSAFTIEKQYVNHDFILVTLGSIFICRIFSIAIPLLLIWLCSGCKPLSLRWNQWIFVYLGGMIRGAISFALSTKITTEHREILKTTTQICALALIVGVGSPLQLFARCLNIKPDREALLDMVEDTAAKRAPAGDDFHKVEDVDQEDAADTHSQTLAPKPEHHQRGHLLSVNDAHSDQHRAISLQAGSSLHFSKAEWQSETAVVQLIDHSFDSLVREGTYPWAIEHFLWFDRKYMMPCFKRR